MNDNQILEAVMRFCSDGLLSELEQLFLGLTSSHKQKIINHYFKNGQTCLILAARNNHLAIVRYLVDDFGADVEQVGTVLFEGESVESVTPLWCASAAGHLLIVEFLVSRGANVNKTTVTSSTALRAACFDGHENVVRFLIQHGADFEIQNRHGHTCLMISCYRGHYSITQYLLDQGARVNRQSTKGNTAMHDCAESGNLNALKLLLKQRPTMHKDEFGHSPLLSSANAGYKPIVEFLTNLSANVQKFDDPLFPSLVFGLKRKASKLYNISIDEQIAAYELLGSSVFDRENDLDRAIEIWHKSLELREKHSRPKQPLSELAFAYEELPPNAEIGSIWSFIAPIARRTITENEADEKEHSYHEPFTKISYHLHSFLQHSFIDTESGYYSNKSEAISNMLAEQFRQLNLKNIPEACDLEVEIEFDSQVRFGHETPRPGYLKRCHRLRAKVNALRGLEPVCVNLNRFNKVSLLIEQGELDLDLCGKKLRELVSWDHPLLLDLKKVCEESFDPSIKEFSSHIELRNMLEAHNSSFIRPSLARSDGDITSIHPRSLIFQSQLIRTRLLGPDHNDSVYYLRLRGAILADSGNIKSCLSLWKTVLVMQRIFLDPVNHVSQTTLISFVELIYFILTDSYTAMPSQDLDPSLLLDCLHYAIDNVERSMHLTYYRYCNLFPWSYSSADKESINLYKSLTLALHFISTVLIFYLPRINPFPQRNILTKFRNQFISPHRNFTPSGCQLRTTGYWNVIQRKRLNSKSITNLKNTKYSSVLDSDDFWSSSSSENSDEQLKESNQRVAPSLNSIGIAADWMATNHRRPRRIMRRRREENTFTQQRSVRNARASPSNLIWNLQASQIIGSDTGPASIIGGGARLAVLMIQALRNSGNNHLELNKNFLAEHEQRFYQEIYRLVQLDPRVQDGKSIIHLACSPETSKLGRCRYPLLPLPVPQLFMILCQMGADPNCRDAFGQRPLGVVLSSQNSIRRLQAELIGSLVVEGAHFDAGFQIPEESSPTFEGNFPSTLSRGQNYRTISLADPRFSEQVREAGLNPVRLTSLACLAARAIRKAGWSSKTPLIREILPAPLMWFVDQH